MVKITLVAKKSLAMKKRIREGDILTHINGNPIQDVLDYRFYLTETRIVLTLLRGAREYTVKLKKEEYEDIGLSFQTPLMDEKHACRNGCIFCFIDQNPKGMRDTVYFKDDDSRLSFLHGNYVTLTNMSEEDVARIVKMRLSPINISIHTTDPALRVKMMNNRHAGAVLRYLDTFREAGLSMCGQIVLCRGYNDGAALLSTMEDLAAYYPAMGSVSVVPAGLTAHREGLCPLSDFSSEEAGEILDMVEQMGRRLYERHGSRIFFAADELYLKAGRPLPPAAAYEGYPQLENGVGMLCSLQEEFALAKEDLAYSESLYAPCNISIATGVAAYDTICAMVAQAMEINRNLQITVYKIVNNFFGKSITVAGLLTGRDIKEQLAGLPLGEALLIPGAALRPQELDFLCGMTLSTLSEALGVPVYPVQNDGACLLDAMLCGGRTGESR